MSPGSYCSLLDRAPRCTVTDQYITEAGIRPLAVRQLEIGRIRYCEYRRCEQ